MGQIVPTASVTPPIEITDERLTDCSVAEPDTSTDEQAYNDTETYAAGDQVIDLTTHLVYESVAGGSGQPLPVPPEETTADWSLVGYSNRWRALDLYSDTATTGPSPLTFEITPAKRANTIVLAGIVGDEVTITQTVEGDVVWSHTQALTARTTRTWTEYLTGDFRQVGLVFRQDMLPLANAVITVEITRATGDVSLGSLLIGKYRWLGAVEVKPDSDTLNFSSFTRDLDGHSKIVPKSNAPKTTQRVWANKEDGPALLEIRNDLGGKPAFWAGLSNGLDPRFGLLSFIGIYTRWIITPDEGGILVQQFDLEGY